MSFGLSFDKLIIIGMIAVFLLGPERLPELAGHLARLVKSVKASAGSAKERLRAEMGPDFDDMDWKKLDPRQYDPRRIILEALTEETTPTTTPMVKPLAGMTDTTVAEKVRVSATGDNPS